MTTVRNHDTLRRYGFVLAVLIGVVFGTLIGRRYDATPQDHERAQDPPSLPGPVEVLAHPASPPADSVWQLMLPAELAADDRPPATIDCDGLHSWGRQRGGLPSKTRLLVQIRAKRDLEVEITEVAARIIEERPTQRKVALECSPRGWRPGQEQPQDVSAFLDTDRAWPHPIVLSPFADPPNRLRLGAGEYAEFQLAAMSRFQDIIWELDISMTIDGQPYNTIVRNGGQPFETPPFPHGAGYVPPGYQWCWNPEPPHLLPIGSDVDTTMRCLG